MCIRDRWRPPRRRYPADASRFVALAGPAAAAPPPPPSVLFFMNDASLSPVAPWCQSKGRAWRFA
eukprot:1077153-Pyramimonas_sp.AAC.1